MNKLGLNNDLTSLLNCYSRGDPVYFLFYGKQFYESSSSSHFLQSLQDFKNVLPAPPWTIKYDFCLRHFAISQTTM